MITFIKRSDEFHKLSKPVVNFQDFYTQFPSMVNFLLLAFLTGWQTVNTEVYYFPRGEAKNMEVLSYAYDSTGTQKMWPTEWVVAYGKGNVYNSSLGHLWEGETYPPAYRCAGYQTTVVRVAEWLATNGVTFPVPEDFPTAATPSLRLEETFLKKY